MAEFRGDEGVGVGGVFTLAPWLSDLLSAEFHPLSAALHLGHALLFIFLTVCRPYILSYMKLWQALSVSHPIARGGLFTILCFITVLIFPHSQFLQILYRIEEFKKISFGSARRRWWISSITIAIFRKFTPLPPMYKITIIDEHYFYAKF